MRAGCVSLPPSAGAMATVEATWTAVSVGTVPVPELHLRGVAHQEVFGAGSTSDFIAISS